MLASIFITLEPHTGQTSGNLYFSAASGLFSFMTLTISGITSPASIRYRNENEILEKSKNPERYYTNVIMQDKLAVDLEYVHNSSLWYDIKLIFQTLWKMVSK